jgi:predicted DNA-binding transcriptional regulator YafY
MSEGTHDTLVYRLAQILIKLNQGEKLNPQLLADEFGVSLRTIQRDLNIRFGYLPLNRSAGHYSLDPSFLGKFDNQDIERFASLAGINGLFPSLSNDFLREIFDERIGTAFMVKGHNYESLEGKEDLFREIEHAIVSRSLISFDYEKNDEIGQYQLIAPYKLINQGGIWYLAVDDHDNLKTFVFTRISNLKLLDQSFEHDDQIKHALENEDGIWLNKEKISLKLRISKNVSGYFKRRKLIANQVIEQELENGDLLVSAGVGHVNQILPIVRYWIPHISIISPENVREAFEISLREYVDKLESGNLSY